MTESTVSARIAPSELATFSCCGVKIPLPLSASAPVVVSAATCARCGTVASLTVARRQAPVVDDVRADHWRYVEDVAAECGAGARWLRRLVRAGELPSRRGARRKVMVRARDVQALIAAQPTAAAAPDTRPRPAPGLPPGVIAMRRGGEQ